MTEKRANEILRTKYPDATIYNGKRFGGASSSDMVVTFEPNGKCYMYYASTYQQVLEKLGFNILYKHNAEAYKSRIEELESHIQMGGEPNKIKLFDKRDFIPYTPEQLENKRAEMQSLKAELESAIIV